MNPYISDFIEKVDQLWTHSKGHFMQVLPCFHEDGKWFKTSYKQSTEYSEHFKCGYHGYSMVVCRDIAYIVQTYRPPAAAILFKIGLNLTAYVETADGDRLRISWDLNDNGTVVPSSACHSWSPGEVLFRSIKWFDASGSSNIHTFFKIVGDLRKSGISVPLDDILTVRSRFPMEISLVKEGYCYDLEPIDHMVFRIHVGDQFSGQRLVISVSNGIATLSVFDTKKNLFKHIPETANLFGFQYNLKLP